MCYGPVGGHKRLVHTQRCWLLFRTSSDRERDRESSLVNKCPACQKCNTESQSRAAAMQSATDVNTCQTPGGGVYMTSYNLCMTSNHPKCAGFLTTPGYICRCCSSVSHLKFIELSPSSWNTVIFIPLGRLLIWCFLNFTPWSIFVYAVCRSVVSSHLPMLRVSSCL